MSLLSATSGHLERAGVRHALIGAAALARHGVARATADIDLLTLDPRVLAASFWRQLEGVAADCRMGDAEDPLAGVVRVSAPGETGIDVVVGKSSWQAGVLERAIPTRIGDAQVPVATAVDLVVLKLYAGGPQDAWDVDQLMAFDPTLEARVAAAIVPMPEAIQHVWARILATRS